MVPQTRALRQARPDGAQHFGRLWGRLWDRLWGRLWDRLSGRSAAAVSTRRKRSDGFRPRPPTRPAASRVPRFPESLLSLPRATES